jgi:hypothetical protein
MIGRIGRAIGAAAALESGAVYPEQLRKKSFFLQARFQESVRAGALWRINAVFALIYFEKFYIELEINKMFAQELIFAVRDENGDTVNLTGASATFRLARHQNTPMILEKTLGDGIVIVGHEVKVSFNASEVEIAGTALKGDFVDQLVITKGGKSICVSEGRITIEPLIA